MKFDDLPLNVRSSIVAAYANKNILNRGEIEYDFELTGGIESFFNLLEYLGMDRYDPTYDYYSYFNNNQNDAWEVLLNRLNGNDAHFPDNYKTMLHPTVSTFSTLVDPEWQGLWLDPHTYMLSDARSQDPDLVDETLDYLGREGLGDRTLYPNGAVALPQLTVTPEGSYTDMVRNLEGNGYVYDDTYFDMPLNGRIKVDQAGRKFKTMELKHEKIIEPQSSTYVEPSIVILDDNPVPLEERALEVMKSRLDEHKPYNNYFAALDMSYPRKVVTLVTDKGVSNCTLNATSAYGPDYTYASARNVINSPMFRQVTGEEIIPGTMLIQSLPDVEDGDKNKYHSATFSGVADHPYINQFGDDVLVGDSLYIYSTGKGNPEAMRERPKSALMNNHGKTFFRYYRPNKKSNGGILSEELNGGNLYDYNALLSQYGPNRYKNGGNLYSGIDEELESLLMDTSRTYVWDMPRVYALPVDDQNWNESGYISPEGKILPSRPSHGLFYDKDGLKPIMLNEWYDFAKNGYVLIKGDKTTVERPISSSPEGSRFFTTSHTPYEQALATDKLDTKLTSALYPSTFFDFLFDDKVTRSNGDYLFATITLTSDNPIHDFAKLMETKLNVPLTYNNSVGVIIPTKDHSGYTGIHHYSTDKGYVSDYRGNNTPSTFVHEELGHGTEDDVKNLMVLNPFTDNFEVVPKDDILKHKQVMAPENSQDYLDVYLSVVDEMYDGLPEDFPQRYPASKKGIELRTSNLEDLFDYLLILNLYEKYRITPPKKKAFLENLFNGYMSDWQDIMKYWKEHDPEKYKRLRYKLDWINKYMTQNNINEDNDKFQSDIYAT